MNRFHGITHLAALILSTTAVATPLKLSLFAMSKLTEKQSEHHHRKLSTFSKVDSKLALPEVSLKPALRLSISASSRTFKKGKHLKFEDIVDTLETSAGLEHIRLTVGRGKVAYGFAGKEISPFTSFSKLSKFSSNGLGKTKHATFAFKKNQTMIRASAFDKGLTLQAIQKIGQFSLMGSFADNMSSAGISQTFSIDQKTRLILLSQFAHKNKNNAILFSGALKISEHEIGMRYSATDEVKSDFSIVYRQTVSKIKGTFDLFVEANQLNDKGDSKYRTAVGFQYWL